MGGKQLTPEQIGRLAEHYREHDNASAAARAVGCSTSCAIGHLRSAGLDVRDSTAKKKPARTVFAELDMQRFVAAIDARRRERHMSWRDVMAEIGGSCSLITRLGNGRMPDAVNVVRLLVWLGETDLAPYLTDRTVRE